MRMEWLKIVAISIAGLAVGVYLGWEWVGVRQPLSFNHRAHTPMACVVCHQGVEARAAAGLPGPQLCVRCHATAPVVRPDEVRRWAAFDGQGGMAWGRLYRVPEHVYFSHRRHVAIARLDCAVCHGDMADRITPPSRPLATVSMDRCLGCHERQQTSADCAACHR